MYLHRSNGHANNFPFQFSTLYESISPAQQGKPPPALRCWGVSCKNYLIEISKWKFFLSVCYSFLNSFHIHTYTHTSCVGFNSRVWNAHILEDILPKKEVVIYKFVDDLYIPESVLNSTIQVLKNNGFLTKEPELLKNAVVLGLGNINGKWYRKKHLATESTWTKRGIAQYTG